MKSFGDWLFSFYIDVDFWILWRVQKFADFVQVWLGLDCVKLAKFAYIIAQALYLAYFFASPENSRSTFFLVINSCVFCSFAVKASNLKVSPYSQNPEMVNFFFSRTLNITLWPFSLSLLIKLQVHEILLFLSVTFFALGLYLHSCTPKPPSQSKLKKLVESLTESLMPVPQPT